MLAENDQKKGKKTLNHIFGVLHKKKIFIFKLGYQMDNDNGSIKASILKITLGSKNLTQ